jgi:hypothetical protein
MKLVINRDYGVFHIEPTIAEELHVDPYDTDARYNPRLIEAVEKLGTERASGYCGCLKVVELPDNTTDHYIDEYDGFETVYYVVDGKIHII